MTSSDPLGAGPDRTKCNSVLHLSLARAQPTPARVGNWRAQPNQAGRNGSILVLRTTLHSLCAVAPSASVRRGWKWPGWKRSEVYGALLLWTPESGGKGRQGLPQALPNERRAKHTALAGTSFKRKTKGNCMNNATRYCSTRT